MKVNEIKKELQNLIDSDLNAILFNGAWGIGKTYNTKEFLADKKFMKEKNYKYLYVSLFGKKSLDEVNTELYNMLNKTRNRVLNVISSVVKLINVGVSLQTGIKFKDNNELQGELKLSNNEFEIEKNNDKGIKKPKKNYLIIIDDFERKSETILNDDFLGYVNSLILQGFKVVVLADLNNKYGMEKHKYNIIKDEKTSYKISKVNWGEDVLGEYKEKVFDKTYELVETPKEIKIELLGSNKDFVDDYLLDEFGNNLRLVIKTNSLFNQIREYIKEKKYQNADLNLIFKCCVYVAIEEFTNKYTKELNDKIKDSESRIFYDNSIHGSIYDYNRKHVKIDEPSFSVYLDSVIDSNYKKSYDKLDDILDVSKSKESIYKSCFFLSDKGKIDLIKKQQKYILSLKVADDDIKNRVNSFINDWFAYAPYLKFNLDNEALFKKLAELDIEIDMGLNNTKDFIEFDVKYKEYKQNFIIQEIFKNLKSKNIDKIYSNMSRLSEMYYPLIGDSKKIILKEFKENGFYINKINGTITYEDWKLTHLICRFISEQAKELKVDLCNRLKELKKQYKDDKSCTNRVNVLINQYGLNR